MDSMNQPLPHVRLAPTAGSTLQEPAVVRWLLIGLALLFLALFLVLPLAAILDRKSVV